MAKIRKLNGYKYNCINGCWWLFHLGDAPDAGFMGYDDGAWKPVSVPHDWSVEYPFAPINAGGPAYLPGAPACFPAPFMASISRRASGSTAIIWARMPTATRSFPLISPPLSARALM